MAIAANPARTSPLRKAQAPPELEAFHRAYYEPVRHYLRSQCRDWDLVDDVLQEGFIVLLLKWDEVGRFEKPQGWLYKAVDLILRNKRRAASRWEPIAGCDEVRSMATVDHTETVARKIDVARLLLNLPPREAQALVLRSFAFTERECSQIMGITLNTFHGYHKDGLSRLQKLHPDNNLTGGAL